MSPTLPSPIPLPERTSGSGVSVPKNVTWGACVVAPRDKTLLVTPASLIGVSVQVLPTAALPIQFPVDAPEKATEDDLGA